MKNQILGTYLARLLAPVWQLNIVALQENGNMVSNSDYFKRCRSKVEKFYQYLTEFRARFIGSVQPRNDSEAVEELEEKTVRQLLSFLNRLIPVLRLIE